MRGNAPSARLTCWLKWAIVALTEGKQGKEMKLGGIALGVALTVYATIASANVTESQFPPMRVRDLIEICAPTKEDPMITAAINYCHGFAQGAILVEEAH